VADSSFDRLVTTLSETERKNFLDRLSTHSDLSTEPLYEQTAEKPRKVEDDYVVLPILLRVWFFLLSVVLGKPPAKVYENSLVSKMGRGINLQFPGLYNYTQGLLLPDLHQALVDLKDAARVFYSALDFSVNKDKGAFYAFMASFEMPELHYVFSQMSSPAEFAKSTPNATPERLKQMAKDGYVENMNAITDTQRDKMYRNVRSLICLKELAGFLFDRLLTAFQYEPALQGKVCPALLVKGQLSALNNILFSLREVPSVTLLSTLFIFSIREEQDSEKMNAELQKLMAHTEKSLATIRGFNRKIPLTLILRCADKDMSYEPVELSGGEDWFAVFRSYWKEKIDGNYDKYVIEKKREAINKALDMFFGDAEIIHVEENLTVDEREAGFFNHTMLFSFLLTIYKKIFLTEMNQVLRPILIDGEFAKKENRLDFTESYNELIRMEDSINDFMRKLVSGGDYGNRYKQLKTDIVSPATRHRKLQVLREDVSMESNAIAERAVSALKLLFTVIHGLLEPEHNGKYASLSNLSTILGKANSDFMIALRESEKKLSLTIDLVTNIIEVEEEYQ
jgi:hypothetical protein